MPPRRSAPPTRRERLRRNAVARVYHSTGRDISHRVRRGWVGQAQLLKMYNRAARAGGRGRKTWKQISATSPY